MADQESYFRVYAAELAQEISVPVILVGGNRTVSLLTEILNETEIEYVALSRPLIREDEIASDIRAGCVEGCSACMRAYPTNALYEPYQIDPTRCVALNTFLTQDGMFGSHIAPEMREKMGTKVQGCEICQEVCPRNRAKMKSTLPDDEYLLKVAEDYSLSKMLNMP